MVERADGAELAGLLGVRGDDERASLEAFLPLLSQWRQTRRETETVNSWRYQVTWQPVADAPSGTLAGSWLMAVPEDMADHETVTACAKAISEHGGNPVVLPVDTTGNPVPADAFTADDGRPVAGVLSLLGLDESAHPEHPVVPAGLLATVRLYQAMEEAGCDARLWSVTSGAVAVADGETAAHPAQAHLWGLNRVAGLENPQRLAGVVDLPADLDSHTTALLVTALAGVGDEDQLAVRRPRPARPAPDPRAGGRRTRRTVDAERHDPDHRRHRGPRLPRGALVLPPARRPGAHQPARRGRPRRRRSCARSCSGWERAA